ncbi:alanine--tRNA ligase [Candidatus Woesearchaeota archaeon]|nr:MAG: alanine--tRNA ligase [Candidatus Woesearchaeota archaeon]
MDEKTVKKQVLLEASAHPEDYFPIKTLKEKGFIRGKCTNTSCGRYFWSQHRAQKTCGDPACFGGFRFIGKKVTTKQLDYIETWKQFSAIHKKLGYTPIKRYPVVARWNPTVDFTIADIAAFQPYVVSGEIAPPANPLVIPQFCLRFGDIDNVGITGHHVGFVMMGEKEFVAPEHYNVERYMADHLTWLTEGMGVKLADLTIHEDVWAGGGNLGPCMEFFAFGLELSNQVYMQYEITPTGELKELKLKVLDMGQGMERVPWFTSGAASIYECSLGPIPKKLREITGVAYDEKFMQQFTPLAPQLNTGEVSDIHAAWNNVASALKMSVEDVQAKILPLAALYSVAEHSRALLVAINDGGLPSNVGGMYNLRVILRRALRFIAEYNWNIDLADVIEWHADYLKPLFPELSENLPNIRKIIEVEKKKYLATIEKQKNWFTPGFFDKPISAEQLVSVYDIMGISPDDVRREAIARGKTPPTIPGDFYALVAQRHAHKEQEHATERKETLPIPASVAPTKALYFDDYEKSSFEGKVLEITGTNVILDQTAFYPTSGGQLSDRGLLNGEKVVDVFKQGPYIVHVLESTPKFHAGDTVRGEIDFHRRIQLAQHHTATHIINAAAREVLGPHCNQAGAKKDTDKAHIDITHYESLSDEQLAAIEKAANTIVQKGIKTELTFMPREEAEKKYGMAIYQGGAVPGKQLRIVNIPGIDVEACGGTHLKSTLETGEIKILKSNKVKDGIVRITFASGAAAKKIKEEEKQLLDKTAALLGCAIRQIPGRAEELFTKWKKARKAKTADETLKTLTSTAEYTGDTLAKTAEILQTQPENIPKTIERFKNDIQQFGGK